MTHTGKSFAVSNKEVFFINAEGNAALISLTI